MSTDLHFVIPDTYAALLQALPDQRVGVDYPYYVGGTYNWVAQTYLVLREYREGLTLSGAPRPGVVNFSHVLIWRDLASMSPRMGEYRLSARADFPRLYDVDFEIVQNKAAVRGSRQIYLPYWPVPGILPRDPARQGVQRIAYAGRIGPNNLAAALQGEAARGLAGLEVAVIAPERWHDMREVDLLVAIRDFSTKAHLKKPPSKLFNAWRANIPLVAGSDSAFAAVGQPGVDYVAVHNAAEFGAAIARLREDRTHYEAIVAAGRARAHEVSHEAIAHTWLNALDGPIAADFERWRAAGGGARVQRPRRTLARALDTGRNTMSGLKAKLLRAP